MSSFTISQSTYADALKREAEHYSLVYCSIPRWCKTYVSPKEVSLFWRTLLSQSRLTASFSPRPPISSTSPTPKLCILGVRVEARARRVPARHCAKYSTNTLLCRITRPVRTPVRTLPLCRVARALRRTS